MLKIVTVKCSAYIFSTLLMFATLLPAHYAMGETADPEAAEELVEPCTPEEIQLTVHDDNGVTFVSGGVGACESQEIQRIAREYQLELVFVRKTARSESYLASIPVHIADKRNSLVLDTVTDGPYLLANIPNGHYIVTAEYNGVTKSQPIQISKKHQRVVFVWRVDN